MRVHENSYVLSVVLISGCAADCLNHYDPVALGATTRSSTLRHRTQFLALSVIAAGSATTFALSMKPKAVI